MKRRVHERVHDIRHFIAIALGQSGTSVATISARLGHRDKATTLNSSSHSIPAAEANAVTYVGSLLGRPATGRGAR